VRREKSKERRVAIREVEESTGRVEESKGSFKDSLNPYGARQLAEPAGI
jgi:hypothetical protein